MTFEEALVELRAGNIGFTAFVRETRDRWRSLALGLMRHWRVPEWVSVEDVEQELLMAASRFVWEYTPGRGPTLSRYVVWNSVDKAKKRMHKLRGASLRGNPDSNPGHIDVPLARWGDDADRFVDNVLNAPAMQEAYAARVAAKERMQARCTTVREKLVVEVLVGSDSVIDVAMLLYADPSTRLACRLSSERHACKVVKRAITRIAGMVEDAA
jgi:hypothetical protein